MSENMDERKMLPEKMPEGRDLSELLLILLRTQQEWETVRKSGVQEPREIGDCGERRMTLR